MNKVAFVIPVLAVIVAVAVLGGAAPVPSPFQAARGQLVVYGDTAYFLGLGRPLNCTISNRFKRGEPIGFRMTAINSETGRRDRATQLVVHLTYAGKTIDIPMRDRETPQEPDKTFWIAKWTVPDNAPPGIIRYTVTARDPQGRTGEYKPFEVDTSLLTIVE